MRRRLALWAVVAAALLPPTAGAGSALAASRAATGLEGNQLAAGTDASQTGQGGEPDGGVESGDAIAPEDEAGEKDEANEKDEAGGKDEAGKKDKAGKKAEANKDDSEEDDSGEETADGGTAAGESGSESSGDSSGSLSSLAIGDGAATLDELDVPVALLSVYQACGSRYGISWEVLAAINKIETGFGTNLGTSGAGAEGWMQFLPSTWEQWGVDADGDGQADTDNPVDAICSAARYLAASGGEEDIYAAVYAYNHADWYVQEVLADARAYERVPANLVNSLTALAAGSTLPVSAGSASWDRTSDGEAESVGITAAAGTSVRAVVAGTVVAVGRGSGGGYIVLRDSYGDRFTYSSLGATAVGEGDVVAAGTTIGRVGASALGFAARLAGSSQLDPTELLEIWRRGGVGGIYDVDGGQGADGASATTQALLMSTPALRRAVLADTDLELPSCVREAVSAGDLRRQNLAALEYLTASGFAVGVDESTCRRRSGFVLEIDSVDRTAVAGNQGQGTAARRLVRTALAMEGSTAPQRVVSTTGLAGSSGGEGAAGTIELDYRPPRKARLVNGEAIAPVGAPAAVQAMIAAANQINETPYVWGGGHGSWVSAGYDCSGAVSYVLHAAEMLESPLTSGSLESWGESGSGRWVTVYANAGHTYAVIAGLRWDTAGNASGSGPRWHAEEAYPTGYTVRHPAGY